MSAKADFTAVMKILAKGSFPFAVYRLPGEDTVKVLIDRSEDLHVVEMPTPTGVLSLLRLPVRAYPRSCCDPAR